MLSEQRIKDIGNIVKSFEQTIAEDVFTQEEAYHLTNIIHHSVRRHTKFEELHDKDQTSGVHET